MRIWIAAGIVTLCVCSPAEVAAQVTVGATLGQSNQPAGDNDSSHLTGPFGGTSLAGIGMIDVAIRARVSVGAEVSLAGDISGAQSERAPGGNNTLASDHHDTVFSGVLKFSTAPSERVRAAAVIGGGLALRHTERVGTFEPFIPPFTKSAVQETLSDYVLAIAGGVDVAVGITSHVALVGVGRLYQLKDDDRTASGTVHRGVSSTIVRFGGGLQFRF